MISKELEFKIIDLYASGHTISWISKQLDVSYDKAREILKLHNIRVRTNSETQYLAYKLRYKEQYPKDTSMWLDEIANDNIMIFREYFENHSTKATKKYFHCNGSAKYFNEFLVKWNISPHSPDLDTYLWKKAISETNKSSWEIHYNDKIKKRNATNLEKYGKINYGCFGSDEHKESIAKKYNGKHFTQLDSYKEKRKHLSMEKYGVPCYLMLPEVRSKNKKWLQENKDLREQKIIATSLTRYGEKHYSETQEYKERRAKTKNTAEEKYRKTCLEKYNAPYYFQSLDFTHKRFVKYYYKSLHFDSLPELAFYLFHEKAGQNIKRLPKKLYYNWEGKSHYYFPDFELDGELIEIKGDHLYEKMLIPNTLENKKLNLMIESNVKILLQKDYQKYVDWFFESRYKKEDFKKNNIERANI